MVELSQEQIEKLKALGRTQKENLIKLGEEFKEKVKNFKASIYTCNATSCHSGGASNVIDAFKESLKAAGLEADVRMVCTGCMGLCASGPLARVEIKGKKPVLYQHVTADMARLIVAEHVAPALKTEGEVKTSDYLKQQELSLDLPFFTKQRKIVLRLLGHSDPEDLGEYIANGGYQGLM